MSKALEKLQEQIETIKHYSLVTSLIYWDIDTIMPEEGFKANSEANAYFSTEAFKLGTSDELFNILEELMKPEEFDNLDSDWQFIVKRMKRQFDEDRRIPVDFYTELVKCRTESEHAWEKAKKASDFSIFAPYLRKIIEMTKQLKAYTHPDKEVYDALLNDYEEGMDSETIDRIFDELKQGLIPLVKDIKAHQMPINPKFCREYDLDEQRRCQKMLLSYIGFNWARGTVGETEHPFTLNLSCHDVRVSNHFREDNAIDPMFSAIHEGGHAIFEQNVAESLDGTAGGSCCYMGIHESQSRFYENILGRNINFWIPIYDKVKETVKGFADVSLDEFYREINRVEPGMIRTMSDEVTYCLHIILRYEMEIAIFRDGVDVDELPALWNKKMEEYLGLVPSNDAEGILQDMHWSDGSFGYFPSYLLGSVYDGMYLDAMQEELGSVDDILRDGRILEITKWLNDKIHRYGSTRLPKEVIENVCHKPVSAEPLMRYFRNKYTELYKL